MPPCSLLSACRVHLVPAVTAAALGPGSSLGLGSHAARLGRCLPVMSAIPSSPGAASWDGTGERVALPADALCVHGVPWRGGPCTLALSHPTRRVLRDPFPTRKRPFLQETEREGCSDTWFTAPTTRPPSSVCCPPRPLSSPGTTCTPSQGWVCWARTPMAAAHASLATGVSGAVPGRPTCGHSDKDDSQGHWPSEGHEPDPPETGGQPPEQREDSPGGSPDPAESISFLTFSGSSGRLVFAVEPCTQEGTPCPTAWPHWARPLPLCP